MVDGFAGILAAYIELQKCRQIIKASGMAHCVVLFLHTTGAIRHWNSHADIFFEFTSKILVTAGQCRGALNVCEHSGSPIVGSSTGYSFNVMIHD